MSKKILCNILVLFLLIFSVAYATKIDILTYDGVAHKYTGPEVTLILNGDEFEVKEGLMQPIILEDRTLVPVREVFEILGGKVSWTDSEKRVDVELGEKTISLWINKTEAEVDGKTITIDVPAKIINDKTMVPARFISEQGDLQVDWDGKTNTVSIKNPVATVKKIEYTKINNINCVVVTAESVISGYKYFMLGEPYRLILDVENSEFEFDTTTQTIEDELISTIRFGNQGNDINRVVLDLKKDTDYIVVPSLDKTKLYFAMATEFSILGETEENSGDKNNQTVTGNKENSGDENNQTTTDNKENSGDENNQTATGNKENSGDEKNQTTTDNKENSGDEKNQTTTDNKENSGDENNQTATENKENSGDENNQETTDDEENLDDKNNQDIIEDNEDDIGQNIIVPDVYITSVKYSTVSKRVKIGYDGSIEYKDSFLTNPNRIVIDIENAELTAEGPKEIYPKGSVITGIRFSQYEEDSVRIVLDLSEKVDYKLYKRTSELQVSVSQPTYKNISYKLNAANAQITLADVDIDDLKAVESVSSNKYTIKYSSSDFDTGEGEITPEDEFIDKISISSSKIVIYDTGNMVYTMRQSGNNVVVTVKKEEDKPVVTDKKVILIDVGHGGSDPGACNGSAQEKVYNLNIALYLYDLLSQREDVELHMTRDDDTYLNREDRVTVATQINPDFIVSIHNNSLENKSYTGTMVLYYNNDTESQYGDVTSKECAQIVLNKLIDALGTVNRGVVNRKDLHILSKTPCPSILCEISFISNDAELERLKTKTFQQDAAQAIYDGVVEILGIM